MARVVPPSTRVTEPVGVDWPESVGFSVNLRFVVPPTGIVAASAVRVAALPPLAIRMVVLLAPLTNAASGALSLRKFPANTAPLAPPTS